MTSTRPTTSPDVEHSGTRLGLPRSGPGSLGPLGRRVAALAIDWAACLAISVGLLRVPYAASGLQGFVPLLVLLVENVVLVGTLGSTLGHRLMGLEVAREDGGPAGLPAAALRSLLLVLVIPAVVWHADGRGYHDRIARTVLLSTR